MYIHYQNDFLHTRNSLLLCVLIPFLILLAHAFYYYPFYADDSYISLRYADRLLEGKGLTWNDGEYVEGYSNLLWVLLSALLGFFGIPLADATRILGVLCSFATLLAIYHYGKKNHPNTSVPIIIANLIIAFSGPVAIWMVGGLEATLVMALMAWACVLLLVQPEVPKRSVSLLIGSLLGAICLTRPEGAIFTMLIAGAMLCFFRTINKHLISIIFLICATSFVIFMAQIMFRLHYYDEYLPNTYYAKLFVDSHERILDGASYIGSALMVFLPVLLIPLLCIDKIRQHASSHSKAAILFLSSISLAWLLITTISGGDIFPGYRHLLPILPLFALIVVECYFLNKQTPVKDAIFYSVALLGFLWIQTTSEENMRGTSERWVGVAKEMGLELKAMYKDSPEKPLIAVGAAGAIPFYSKLPTLDIFGLNDHYLAHNRKKTGYKGRGYLAHELFNLEYIKQRKPDILVFKLPEIPDICTPHFNDCGDLHDDYCKVMIKLSTTELPIWIRKGSKFAKYPDSQPSAHCLQ